jgi:hypothetical protein
MLGYTGTSSTKPMTVSIKVEFITGQYDKVGILRQSQDFHNTPGQNSDAFSRSQADKFIAQCILCFVENV